MYQSSYPDQHTTDYLLTLQKDTLRILRNFFCIFHKKEKKYRQLDGNVRRYRVFLFLYLLPILVGKKPDVDGVWLGCGGALAIKRRRSKESSRLEKLSKERAPKEMEERSGLANLWQKKLCQSFVMCDD